MWCHTNLDRVELLLNGKSYGSRDVQRNSHVMWKVPYVPGKLDARGFKDGRVVLTRTNETTGAAARIVARADRSQIAGDGADVAIITISVVDAEGRMVPTANNDVSFQVSGSGRLLGVGNGDPSSHESDRGPRRRAFNGLCMGIVQASKTAGSLRIDATSEPLAPATIELTVTG